MDDVTAVDAEVIEAFQPEGTSAPSGLACLVMIARRYGLVLTVPQLVHDNLLSDQEVTVAQLITAAAGAGMRAEAIRLDWGGLFALGEALPAIVRMRDGSSMVLLRTYEEEGVQRLVLQDPNAGDDAVFSFDRLRFESSWTKEVLLVRRNYDLAKKDRQFNSSLIKELVLRERRMVRDIAICALVLGFLALIPILFWREMINLLYTRSVNTFTVLCTAMLLVILFEGVIYFTRRFLIVHLSERIDDQLNRYVFDKVLNLPMDFFERAPVGLVTQRMYSLNELRQFLEGQVLGTILDSTTLLFFLPVMAFFALVPTLMVFVMCGIIILWLLKALPGLKEKLKAVNAAEIERGNFLIQTIHGIRTVKSLVLEPHQRYRFDIICARVARARMAQQAYRNVVRTVVRPLNNIAVSGSLALAVLLVLLSTLPGANQVISTIAGNNNPGMNSVASGIPDYGSVYVFLILTRLSVQPLISFASSIDRFDEVRLRIDEIGEIVNQTEEHGRTGHGVRSPLQGDAQFSDVTFKYPGASLPALQSVSFEVKSGMTLGVVGRSGSGKSTVTRLLQGLHSDYEGTIKVEGIDIREYEIDHLRSNLGVVPQENFLFSGTIRENIMAAKSQATFDEVVRAARLAGAEEFIDRMPKGYETFIHEGSPNLSGGQRQRIAIARALILEPRILILDEATSALDPESEAIVNANLVRIARGRALIVVSHRLSSLVKSDAILVLERGQVEDLGRHEDLLVRCEVYRHLWAQQNRHLSATPVRPDKPAMRMPSLVS